MAQNSQIIGNIQQAQHHLPDGADDDDINIHPAIEAQELERHIAVPGNDDYQLILPGYMADIPEKVNNGDNNIILGVQPMEINRVQQYDNVIQRAHLDFIYAP